MIVFPNKMLLFYTFFSWTHEIIPRHSKNSENKLVLKSPPLHPFNLSVVASVRQWWQLLQKGGLKNWMHETNSVEFKAKKDHGVHFHTYQSPENFTQWLFFEFITSSRVGISEWKKKCHTYSSLWKINYMLRSSMFTQPNFWCTGSAQSILVLEQSCGTPWKV